MGMVGGKEAGIEERVRTPGSKSLSVGSQLQLTCLEGTEKPGQHPYSSFLLGFPRTPSALPVFSVTAGGKGPACTAGQDLSDSFGLYHRLTPLRLGVASFLLSDVKPVTFASCAYLLLRLA